MKIIINIFGSNISIKEEVILLLESSMLRDVLGALRNRPEGAWRRILKDDLSLEKGWIILVNGRNVSSLQNLETKINEGDDITLTVMIAGG